MDEVEDSMQLSEEPKETVGRDLTDQITKKATRSRYPWKDMNFGDWFIIQRDAVTGFDSSRQLCYSANKSEINKKSEIRFKAFTNSDRSVTIKRTS